MPHLDLVPSDAVWHVDDQHSVSRGRSKVPHPVACISIPVSSRAAGAGAAAAATEAMAAVVVAAAVVMAAPVVSTAPATIVPVAIAPSAVHDSVSFGTAGPTVASKMSVETQAPCSQRLRAAVPDSLRGITIRLKRHKGAGLPTPVDHEVCGAHARAASWFASRGCGDARAAQRRPAINRAAADAPMPLVLPYRSKRSRTSSFRASLR